MSRQHTQEILGENGDHVPTGNWLSKIFSRGKKMADEALGGPTTTPVEEAQTEVEELHGKEFLKKLTFKTLKDIWTIYTNPAEMLSIGGIWKLTGGQYQLWLKTKKEVIERLKDKYATSFATESHRLWEQGGRTDDLSLPKNKLGDYKRFLQLMGLSVHTPTETAPEEPVLQFVEAALEDARQFDEQAQNIRARFEAGELNEAQVEAESQELFNTMRTNQVAHVEQVAKAAEKELPEKQPVTAAKPVEVAPAPAATHAGNAEYPEPIREKAEEIDKLIAHQKLNGHCSPLEPAGDIARAITRYWPGGMQETTEKSTAYPDDILIEPITKELLLQNGTTIHLSNETRFTQTGKLCHGIISVTPKNGSTWSVSIAKNRGYEMAFKKDEYLVDHAYDPTYKNPDTIGMSANLAIATKQILEEGKQTLLQSAQPTNALLSRSDTPEEIVFSEIKDNPPTVSIAEVYRQFCIRIVSHKMQMLGEVVTFNFSGEATEIKDPKENVIQRIKKASVEELQTKGPIDFINEALNATIDPDPQINQYADLFHTLLLQDEFRTFTFNQQSYSALQNFLQTKSPEGEMGDNAALGVQRQVTRYVIQHTLDKLLGAVGPGDMRVDRDHDQFLNAILLAFEKKLSR